MSVDACFSRYVSPEMNLQLVEGDPVFARRCRDRGCRGLEPNGISSSRRMDAPWSGSL